MPPNYCNSLHYFILLDQLSRETVKSPICLAYLEGVSIALNDELSSLPQSPAENLPSHVHLWGQGKNPDLFDSGCIETLLV